MARTPRSVVLLDAPSNLGLKSPAPGVEPGVRGMPAALRKQGLIERMRHQGVMIEDAGTVVPPAYHEAIDASVGVRNARSIRDYSQLLAHRLTPLLTVNKFPLVLGGDCSVLLGSGLALASYGRCGLLFIDGHADLLTPANSQSGGAAGMDLALATGTGPDFLTNIDSKRPYIQPQDALVFGYRVPRPEDPPAWAPQLPMTGIPLSKAMENGIERAAVSAIAQLESSPTRGFWVHVDLDVLASEWMPAVDSPEPGGMTPDELVTVLRAALHSSRCLGMECSIYDPTLDPTRRGAEVVVHILCEAFGAARH